MKDLPDTLKPSEVDVRVIRRKATQESPRSIETTLVTTPYAKLAVALGYKPSRAAVATAYFGRLASAETNAIRVPLLMSNRARGTALLQATGTGTLLTVTEVGTGAPSRPLVNGGVGFKQGQVISVVAGGENYCYLIDEDQVHPTQVRVGSRIRSGEGTIASAVPLSYDPAYIVGRVASDISLSWAQSNLYSFVCEIEEYK